jgi:hypothetical protein
MDFCKIYYKNKIFRENLSFDANISLEMGKFPWIYGDMHGNLGGKIYIHK